LTGRLVGGLWHLGHQSRCCLHGRRYRFFRLLLLFVLSWAAFARMNADASAGSLLDELDHRQDDVLDELERLNCRIEQVIAEVLSWRGAEAVPQRAAA
jgi:hypothetical protein